MSRDQDVCACGHFRGYHYFRFGRCVKCSYSCWFFRLRRATHGFVPFAGASPGSAWRLVRFECGCTRYVDANVALAPDGLLEVYCSRPEHGEACGVEVVP